MDKLTDRSLVRFHYLRWRKEIILPVSLCLSVRLLPNIDEVFRGRLGLKKEQNSIMFSTLPQFKTLMHFNGIAILYYYSLDVSTVLYRSLTLWNNQIKDKMRTKFEINDMTDGASRLLSQLWKASSVFFTPNSYQSLE